MRDWEAISFPYRNVQRRTPNASMEGGTRRNAQCRYKQNGDWGQSPLPKRASLESVADEKGASGKLMPVGLRDNATVRHRRYNAAGKLPAFPTGMFNAQGSTLNVERSTFQLGKGATRS